MTKTATSAVTLPAGGGTANVSYGITVQNNGPGAANNVVFTDAAPVGVTFTGVTAGKGCAIAGNAVTCNLGGLATGNSVQFSISATVNAAGSYTNTGTAVDKATTDGGDTNLNNNSSSATTTVTAPAPGVFTPPVVKSKAKVLVICNTLAATPKVLRANGKKQVVVIHVTKRLGRTTASAKKVPAAGIHVLLTGSGVHVIVTTNKNGVAFARITPSKAGVIRVNIKGKKACNSVRLGAARIFEPTVTG